MPYLLAPLPRERWRRRSSAPVEPLPLLLPSSISSPIPMPATLLQPRRAVSPTAWLRSGGLTGGHTFFSHPTRSLASCSLARAARRRPPSSTPPAPPRPQTAPPLSCLAPLPRAMTETGRRSGGRSGRSCDFWLHLAQIALVSRYSGSFSTKAVLGWPLAQFHPKQLPKLLKKLCQTHQNMSFRRTAPSLQLRMAVVKKEH